MHPVTEALLRWYDRNAREMPWRGIADPYGTWVSEIMLQQTRVETVRDYYPEFMARFPNVAALAEAPEEDVLKEWEGLGYYSRASNLHEGARQVMEEFGGVLPDSPDELRKIRGIGPYTSCSIASIAYNVPVPAVDGNVVRVICRLYDIHENPKEARVHAKIEGLAAELVPQNRAGDHNQAMMDLGATVCVPGTPDCERCPLREMCRSCAAGTAEDLPNMPRSKPPKEMDYDVIILCSAGKVLVYRRTETMLRGLWCFPMTEGHRKKEELSETIRKEFLMEGIRIQEAGEARHVFTHQVWRMKLYLVQTEAETPARAGYVWIPAEEIGNLAMPVAVSAARRVAESCAAGKHFQKTEKNGENRSKSENYSEK